MFDPGSTMMRIFRPAIAALAAAAMLGGCAPGTNMFGGTTLAVSPADPCGGERKHFADSQNYFAQEIAVRALEGGLAGAGAGALIGGLAGGTKGLLIGAGTGLVVGAGLGAASGYWDKLQQEKLDNQHLAAEVSGTEATEVTKISETAEAFSGLRTCRFAHAAQIKRDAQRGLLARSDAVAQLAEEKNWFDQEVKVAVDAGLNMQKRDDQFAYAAKNLPKARSKSDPANTAQVAATETIPQKRNSFETSIKTAEAQSTNTFSMDTSTTQWLHGPGDA